MSDRTTSLRQAVVDRAVRGAGRSSPADRQAAFENIGVAAHARTLVDTVARNAWKVTSAHVAAALSAGMSEDELFELAVCAALGQAERQRAAAVAALDEVFAASAPVREGGTR